MLRNQAAMLALMVLLCSPLAAAEGFQAEQKQVPQPAQLVWEPEHAAVAQLASDRGQLSSASYLPNGTEIVCVTDAGTVLVLDGKDLSVARSLQPGARYSLPGIAPDGRRIAMASRDNHIEVWSLIEPQKQFSLGQHPDAVLRITWSPNGRWIASGGDDGTLQLFDADTRSLVTRLELGGKAIAALQFSPDSQVLAVRTQGEIVLLWDVNQRQEKLRLSNQGNNACTVAFSPDGAFWATMRDPESIVIRRGLTDVEVARHGARWADVAWSPDGRMIAVASGARMTLLDAATRGVLHEFDCCGSWIDSLAFAPDSRKLVTVSGTGRLAVWDVSSIEALKVATTPPVDSVASKNGRYSSPLRIYDAPDDRARFGDFCEYGLRNREDEIPDGYWVYSAPRWYVFRQSRIGLGAPPRDLPEPYLHAGQRRIWIACPNASCVQAGCKAALGMPRRIQQVKRAMLIYQHGFQFKDTARSWGPTAVLEVYLDERTGTEEALELIDRDGWGLEEAEILDSTEARAAGLIDGP